MGPCYQPIENYGVIGNLRTAALVGMDGSIDWLCLPHFDSPSVFAAILDDQKGGRFRIAPAGEDFRLKQFYWPDTAVLVTRFLHDDGVGEVEDYMPIGGASTVPDVLDDDFIRPDFVHDQVFPDRETTEIRFARGHADVALAQQFADGRTISRSSFPVIFEAASRRDGAAHLPQQPLQRRPCLRALRQKSGRFGERHPEYGGERERQRAADLV